MQRLTNQGQATTGSPGMSIVRQACLEDDPKPAQSVIRKTWYNTASPVLRLSRSDRDITLWIKMSVQQSASLQQLIRLISILTTARRTRYSSSLPRSRRRTNHFSLLSARVENLTGKERCRLHLSRESHQFSTWLQKTKTSQLSMKFRTNQSPFNLQLASRSL